MRDGRLEAIFRKWNVWNDDQPRLFAQRARGRTHSRPMTGYADRQRRHAVAVGGARAATCRRCSARPLITLVLSCGAMLLAVALGVAIATGRIYGGRLAQLALTGYVELIRGTPLLLQLFVLYYGIAAAIRLPAFVAALLGLALNYAAYESEIYRGALLAVPSASSRRRARSVSASSRRSGSCAGRRRFGSRLRR